MYIYICLILKIDTKSHKNVFDDLQSQYKRNEDFFYLKL